MAGGAGAGGSSLSQTQLVLLLLVAAIFALLLTANIGLCWLYRRLLTEDQRQTRRAQKKKMSDVWVYQVTRPAHSPPPPPPSQQQPEDPPSQQILRKLRRSYDNLRSAVEAGEGEGGPVRLSREESQAIEELEVTADLFLHDTPHNHHDHHHHSHSHSHSRRSSFSVYDNDADHADGPFLAGHDMDINAFTASDHVNVSASFMEPERSAPGHQRPGGILAPHCRSPVTTPCGDPGSPSSVFTDDDSVFYHDTGPTVPSIAHLSVLRHTGDSATQNIMLAPNHTEVPTTTPLSALPDIDLDTLNGNVHLSSVTLEDFENHPAGTGTGRRARGKKGKRGAKRRGSTYDNVATSAQAFPVAEFHNEAFHFTTGETAAVEVVNDLDL